MRSDLAPPVLKRVEDRKNYGDESNAYSLMNPSIYSNKGVYEKDFLMPQSREEVIIRNAQLKSCIFTQYKSNSGKNRYCLHDVRPLLQPQWDAYKLYLPPISPSMVA